MSANGDGDWETTCRAVLCCPRSLKERAEAHAWLRSRLPRGVAPEQAVGLSGTFDAKTSAQSSRALAAPMVKFGVTPRQRATTKR